MHLAEQLDVSEQLKRAVAYGDGLFESMLFVDGGCALLDLHINRLTHGAERLSLDFCPNTTKRATAKAVARHSSAIVRVKIILCRHGRDSGYSGGHQSELHINTSTPESLSSFQSPIALDMHPFELGVSKTTGGLKTLNRIEQVIAAQNIGPRFNERLCVDQRGLPAELVYHNLFVITGTQIITHSLDSMGVRGVMRHWVIDQLADSGTPVKLTANMPSPNQWEGAFATNAINGIRAITTLGADRHLNSDKITLITELQQTERESRGIASFL